jgi:ketosteroid isomerase-like protein
MRRIQALSAAIALTFFVGPAMAEEEPMTTAQVLEKHLELVGNRDLPAVMEFYAPDAFMITPDAILQGPDQIRTFFVAQMAEFALPGLDFELKEKKVNGNIAYIVWTADTAENTYHYASDTFVIENGRIVAQTIAFSVTPK